MFSFPVLGNRLGRSPAIAAVAFLLLSGLAAAQNSDLASPSPANGHSQVIAQGMAAPTDSRMQWRIVEREIPLRIDARPSDRLPDGPGFLLASESPLFVTDQRTKLRTRLAVGEAVFVTAGANQSWASLNDQAASAHTLELVSRSQADQTQGGTILFTSRAFRMTNGDYDIDLVRDRIAKNESSTLSSPFFPVLIFATEGTVSVRSDNDAKPVTLKTGEAAAPKGTITISAVGGKPATIVAAIIGPVIGGGGDVPTATAEASETATTETTTPTEEATAETEPTPRPTRTQQGTGSLLIYVLGCPGGMRPSTWDLRFCTELPKDYELQLITPNGDVLTMDDAEMEDSHTIEWTKLRRGDHQLVVSRMPKGYDTVTLDGYSCCPVPDGFLIQVEPGDELIGVIYFFLPSGAAAAPPDNSGPDPEDRTDTDLDGLSDYDEIYVYGTDPYLNDTDGDGVNDSNEINAGTDPFDITDYP